MIEQKKSWEALNISKERWFNLEDLSNEIWKDIKGFEDKYKISSYGRVKSLEREVNCLNNKTRKILTKILSFTTDSNNYYYVRLYPIFRKGIAVHRLIGQTFLSKGSDDTCLNHKDGNKLNNNVNNLEWTTFKKNIQHAWSIGLCSSILRLGEKNGQAKFKECEVLEIRRLYSTDQFSQRLLAKMFKTGKTSISHIVKREIWKHI